MYNYYLYHVFKKNKLFNAIVTCMNKYIIIIIIADTLMHNNLYYTITVANKKK